MLIFLASALDLNKRINNLSPDLSPSEIVTSPEKLLGIFGGYQPDVHLGRPGGAPAVIFSPALAALQQRLDRLESVDVSHQEVVGCVGPYLRYAVEFSGDEQEQEREETIRHLIDMAVGQPGRWRYPAGRWWHKEFLMLIVERENTSSPDGDALNRAIIGYRKIVSGDKVPCTLSVL